jgi:VWFA-related protein
MRGVRIGRKLILLGCMAVGSLAAKTITVEQLGEVVGAAVASHRSDRDTARAVAGLELAERITEDRLAALQSRAPGPRTATTLEELMEKSAFLDAPASEGAAGAPPPLAEQRNIFQRVVSYVLDYAKRLPNLMCTEAILRFNDDPWHRTVSQRALGRLHFTDAIGTQITYSNSGEETTVKTFDNHPYTGTKLLGVTTYGEFGNAMIALIAPGSKTKAYWSHWEVLHGKRVAVFRYSVAQAGSQYSVSYGCAGTPTHSVKAAYDGLVFLEAESGTILRITRMAVGLSPQFPTKVAKTAVEYGPISIGGDSFMLPIRSVSELDNPAGCDDFGKAHRLDSLNEIRFYDYRLFAAESKMVASGESEGKHDIKHGLPLTSAENSAAVPVPAAPSATEPLEPEVPAETAQQAAGGTNESVFSLPQAPPYQEAERADGNASFSTHATFRERLNIVTVPVVVRDRGGEALTDLTQQDFEILDNGKRQLITNFAKQSGEVAAASKTETLPAENKTFPDRYVAYVFDDIHLTAGDLSQTRSAAMRGLKDLLDAGTRIAILTTSGHVRLGFTSQPDKIVAALNRVRPSPLAVAPTDCPDVSYYVADQIVNRNDRRALDEEASEAVQQCNVPQQMAQDFAFNAAQRSLAIHDNETRVTLDAIRGMAQGMAVLPGERTMLLVSPGFYASAGLAGMQEVIDRAARSGLVIQSLDARGLYSPAGFNASQGGRTSANKLKYQQNEQQLDGDPLVQLADATGGRIFRNSNDYDAGFRRLSERPGIVYLLGFSPSDRRENGSYHKLKVGVKGSKGLEIQARRGYIARHATQDAAKEAKEEIQNALLSRDDLQDIAMSVRSSGPGTGDGRKLSLLIHVDARQVQFQKQDRRNRDKLTLTFGFFDADGAMVSVLGEEVPLDFSDSDLLARLDSGINIRSDLDVKPDARFLRVVLRDAAGQMSTLNEAVDQ